MLTKTKLLALLATLLFSASAVADPITIDYIADDAIPDAPGGHTTVDYTIVGDDGTPVTSFTNDGNQIDLLGSAVTIETPYWSSPVGTIFAVHGNTVTLDPANPLGAISFIITAAGNAGIWVSADWSWSDGSGSGTLRNPDQNYTSINSDGGSNNAIGVAIYAEPGACITEVTVDPSWWWGIGSISTADCASVPEPGSLSLLSLGLLYLGFVARRRSRVV